MAKRKRPVRHYGPYQSKAAKRPMVSRKKRKKKANLVD